MPLTAYVVWLLVGMMLLRFIPLVFLCGCAATAAVVAMVVDGSTPTLRGGQPILTAAAH